ncbi:MAG: ABC transporter permease [Halioglobus sp.]
MKIGRLFALAKKEALQILRDPSALLIAFVLPPMLLFLFSYGVSLDVKNVNIGVVLENDGAFSRDLAAAYDATAYFNVTPVRHRKEIERGLINGDLAVFVVIPQDFDARMADPSRSATIQVITDGSQPNSANFSAGYAQGVFNNWLSGQANSLMTSGPGIQLQQRFWFNPELDSRRVIVPGAIALVMTIIGTLLTAMVIAREWERGTMEALMSTPASKAEIIVSKLIPYFVLGMLAISGCTFLAVEIFEVPLRGSLAALLLVSAVFLLPALGLGLLISAVSASQFQAATTGLLLGFMPTLLLSGFVYEIQSMPVAIQWVTHIVPARYFVASLQTIFLAGDVWSDLIPNIFAMLALGFLLFGVTFIKTREGMD